MSTFLGGCSPPLKEDFVVIVPLKVGVRHKVKMSTFVYDVEGLEAVASKQLESLKQKEKAEGSYRKDSAKTPNGEH